MAEAQLADLAAERALVEGLLFDPDAIPRVAHLDADAVTDAALCAVLRALRACWTRGEGVEVPQLMAELHRSGAFHAIGGERFLGDLIERGHSSAFVEVHARRVEALAACRSAELSLRRALGRLRAPELTPEDALAAAASVAATLAQSAAPRGFDLASHASRAWDEFDERSSGLLVNARWGVPSFDHELSLGGLISGGLYVLAADTGRGKTTLAWQAALATAATGRRVLVYSQEMPGPELVWRLAGARLGLSTAQIRTGHLSDGQLQGLGRATAALGRLPIEIRDTGEASPDRIRAEVIAESARGGLGLVVVDYLQILTVDPDQRRAGVPEQLSYATKTLKRTAVRARVPMLLLSQFNRGRNTSERPTLSDLKGSGSIEQDADAVVLLHPTPDGTEAIFAKHRHGPPIEPSRLRWVGQDGRFEDEHEPPPPAPDARCGDADEWGEDP